MQRRWKFRAHHLIMIDLINLINVIGLLKKLIINIYFDNI